MLLSLSLVLCLVDIFIIHDNVLWHIEGVYIMKSGLWYVSKLKSNTWKMIIWWYWYLILFQHGTIWFYVEIYCTTSPTETRAAVTVAINSLALSTSSQGLFLYAIITSLSFFNVSVYVCVRACATTCHFTREVAPILCLGHWNPS